MAKQAKQVEYRDLETVTSGSTNADVTVGESVRIFGTDYPGQDYEKSFDMTFKVGDQAEYGAYNLRYYGPILAITPKTVLISASSTGERKKRLKIAEFCWRNKNFDLEKVRAENAETMQCI